MNKFTVLVGVICLFIGTILILISGFVGDFIVYNGMYDSSKFLVINNAKNLDLNDYSPRVCNIFGCIYKTNNCTNGIYIGGWCIDKKLEFGEFQGLFMPNFEYIENNFKIIENGGSIEIFIDGNLIQNYKVFRSGGKYIFIYEDENKYNYILLDEYYLKDYTDTNQIIVKCKDNKVIDVNIPIKDSNFYVLNTNDRYDSLKDLKNNFRCNYEVICDDNLNECYYVKKIDLNQ
jgi:hypothetical protein